MPAINNQSPALCVVGGGIVGLWTAFFAARQGIDVTLVEKGHLASGASGGVLGALMPHQPNAWNENKQFQLDGLMSLPDEIAALEDITGLRTGYRRCGRLMPIRHAQKRRQSAQWADASHDNWPDGHRWQVLDDCPAPEWLPQAECPHGLNQDTISARVHPRALTGALLAALRSFDNVTILEATQVGAVSSGGRLDLVGGEAIRPHRTILACGWQTFPLIQGHFSTETGRGVKGQAALLKPAKPADPASPIIYDNGVYVIAHDNGLVAIGSTSENDFDDPYSIDDGLDDLISRAAVVCPSLHEAEAVERWAGVRPRASGREPLVGPLPGLDRTLVATGGFKISFAIAHLMAKAALMQSADQAPDFLPTLFLPENRGLV